MLSPAHMTLSFLWLCRLSSLLGAEGLNPRWVGTPRTAVCVDLNHISAHLALFVCSWMFDFVPQSAERWFNHLSTWEPAETWSSVSSTPPVWPRPTEEHLLFLEPFLWRGWKRRLQGGKTGSPETSECEMFDWCPWKSRRCCSCVSWDGSLRLFKLTPWSCSTWDHLGGHV